MERRTFLGLASVFPVAARLPALGESPRIGRHSVSGRREGESMALDEALERCHRYGPEYSGGLSNHGTMVAEALAELGQAERAPAWVSAYKQKRPLEEAPGPRPAFPGDSWREHLGQRNSYPRWLALFEAELAEAPWPEVLRRWLPRLVPGLTAAAAHGLIRTSHAVRSLERETTTPRMRELAMGLAYWSATYQELPGAPGETGDPAGLDVEQALEQVQRLPQKAALSGLISAQLRALDDHRNFAGVIDLVDVRRPDFLAELATTFSRLYVQAPPGASFAWVHAVTGPGALRPLAPYLDAQGRGRALQYAWQLSAGLYSVYRPERFLDEPAPEAPTQEDLIARALDNGNAHAIKLAAVALQEYRVSPDPWLLRGAWFGAATLRG